MCTAKPISQTDKQADRETDRHTDSYTDRMVPSSAAAKILRGCTTALYTSGALYQAGFLADAENGGGLSYFGPLLSVRDFAKQSAGGS